MKDYFYDINENYSIIKQIKLSVVISFSLLILDILDIPSKIITKYDFPVFFLMSIAIVILIGLTIIENGLLDMFKILSINRIDAIICVKLFSILIYTTLIYLMDELYLYKFIMLGVSLVFILIIGTTRNHKYDIAKKQSKEYKSNIVDLKDLYDGNIGVLEGKPILLDEKDVDYDLLDRGKIINYLYDAIISTNPDGKFVISLEGEWGSGKTTIIKNVKRMILQDNKDVVVIDEFDPWIYGDENTLLLNMFNLILQKSGFKYSNLFTDKIAEDLSELVLGTNKSSLIKSIFFENSAVNMKSKINNYLKLSGKKFVFFVDNIDRAEKENVILLFKLVGSILDFERITYVLSFDDKRVREIFKRDFSIDYEYLKKIINLQIRIPEIDKSVLSNLYATSLKKLLAMYGESEENLSDYNSFIRFISNKRLDVRDFKRFINSAVNLSFKTRHFLYKKDLLIMEFIKMFNFPLYKAIHDNKEYFISHDQMYDHQVYKVTYNREKFNSEGKAFLGDLFRNSDNENYREILGEIFPYVNKYNNSQDLVYTGNIISKDPDYITISKLRRISSAKYFDLYFTETSNAYTEIGNIVENLINKINKQQPLINKNILLEEILSSVHYSYHKEIFERVQLYVDDFEQENIYDFVKILFNNVEVIDDSREFMALSARSRVAVIIHTLLNKISNYEYVNFLESITKEYSRLRFLQDVSYWFTSDKEDININGRKELLEETIEKMAEYILKNNINLYEDINYMPKNIWGLYDAYKEEQDKVKSYIKVIICETNIFRFLNDMIGISVGTGGYRYSISKERLEAFTSKADVDLIIKGVEPKTSDEKFVLEVYKAYDEDIKDIWGDAGIAISEEKKLTL